MISGNNISTPAYVIKNKEDCYLMIYRVLLTTK